MEDEYNMSDYNMITKPKCTEKKDTYSRMRGDVTFNEATAELICNLEDIPSNIMTVNEFNIVDDIRESYDVCKNLIFEFVTDELYSKSPLGFDDSFYIVNRAGFNEEVGLDYTCDLTISNYNLKLIRDEGMFQVDSTGDYQLHFNHTLIKDNSISTSIVNTDTGDTVYSKVFSGENNTGEFFVELHLTAGNYQIKYNKDIGLDTPFDNAWIILKPLPVTNTVQEINSKSYPLWGTTTEQVPTYITEKFTDNTVKIR